MPPYFCVVAIAALMDVVVMLMVVLMIALTIIAVALTIALTISCRRISIILWCYGA